MSNLGSIPEGAFPSLLVVEASLVRDAYSDHSDKAPAGYLKKIMGEEVAGDTSSTKNHDEHVQATISSCDLNSVKTN